MVTEIVRYDNTYMSITIHFALSVYFHIIAFVNEQVFYSGGVMVMGIKRKYHIRRRD